MRWASIPCPLHSSFGNGVIPETVGPRRMDWVPSAVPRTTVPNLPDDVVAVASVSFTCSSANLLAGVAVAAVRRRRPDFRLILAYAALAPLTIPVLGGYAMAISLIPILPCAGLVAFVIGRDLTSALGTYTVVGIYAYGIAIQVVWLWNEPTPLKVNSNNGRQLGFSRP